MDGEINCIHGLVNGKAKEETQQSGGMTARAIGTERSSGGGRCRGKPGILGKMTGTNPRKNRLNLQEWLGRRREI